MSFFDLNDRSHHRHRMLASAAVAALIASGAIGGMVMSASAPASAAAVVTSDLQSQSLPSFATVVERVKPAVVSVKVNIENAAANSDELSGQMDNLPPQIQQFFKRFGDQNGMAPASDGAAARDRLSAPGSSFPPTATSSPTTMSSHNAKTVTVTTNDGKSSGRQGDRHRPQNRSGAAEGDEKGDYPFVSFAKEAPRVGDWVVADRQSLRPRRHRDRRHHLGRRPRHRRRPL